MERQVLPRFGSTPLRRITNGEVRGWVRDLLAQELSAATVRKAVFALRQCLAAAVADGRLTTNPADAVPLPTERPRPARYLSSPKWNGSWPRCRGATRPSCGGVRRQACGVGT